MHQLARNIALDPLFAVSADGRPRPVLAQGVSVSTDGLTYRISLRPSLRFHDGKPVTPEMVKHALLTRLSQNLGPAFDDVREIKTGDAEISFVLKRRSRFLVEGLDVPIVEPGTTMAGTGPFYVSSERDDATEMQRNPAYYDGGPSVERLTIQSYRSIRAAWADLLRDRIDMLYEVGVEAFDSLQPSTQVKLFEFQRPYTYLLLLNTRKPYLRDAKVRRQLNAAVDRSAFVQNALRGHGVVADGPVSPLHWAYDRAAPRFAFAPEAIAGLGRLRLECLFADASHERMALVLQSALNAIGVDLEPRLVSGEELFKRAEAGDFDTIFADLANGPTMARANLFWHSGSPLNYGGFSSAEVDSALDTIRHAADDDEYKRGVAAFQRAMVVDPPAIFLAWSQRARAVSRRFDVPAEPGRDILSSLRLWRPAADGRVASRN